MANTINTASPNRSDVVTGNENAVQVVPGAEAGFKDAVSKEIIVRAPRPRILTRRLERAARRASH